MTASVRLALLLIGMGSALPAAAEVLRVSDPAALTETARRAAPGDTVVLASGTLRDVQMVIDVRGTAERPITIAAETPGGVIVSGRSSLLITGAHLVVSGLVFRDGHAPGQAVIETAPGSEDVRLREIVIDAFNPPDRRTPSAWVWLRGRNHQVERGWFAGKGNAGPTIEASGQHRIEASYFGPREPLGAIGGEAIRVSGSVDIAGNLFDRQDAGVAIVNLAGGGSFRGNTIRRSAGQVVLRGRYRAERNVVRGDGKADTGGLLATGANVTIRDNYVDRVAGDAIAVAGDGAGATIENNSVIDSARLSVDGGSATLTRNLLRNTVDPIRVSGGRATFTGNVSSFDPPAVAAAGMRRDKHDFTATPAGLLHLATAPGVGAPLDLAPVAASAAGPAWYAKPTEQRTFAFAVADTIVPAGGLTAAVAAAAPSAVLVLRGGDHLLAAPLVIDRPLTIRGRDGARLRFRGATAFQLARGGSLRLESVAVSGSAAPRRAGNAVVRAPLTPTTANYTVVLDHVTFSELDRGAGFDVIATTPGTLATRIDLRGVAARDVSGALVSAPATDGRYAAQFVRITDAALDAVRTIVTVAGGAPGSGHGPVVEVTDTAVTGGGAQALRLTDVARATISGNRFRRAGAVEVSARAPSAIRCNLLPSTAAPRAGANVTLEPDPQAPRCIAERLARGEDR
ncbi:polysaccharide lyase 6 family protein [Sphingomonas guangdongensis]|nr:polysaccharide lyase 6 family protein [Sphingomonas guangdongensis]